MTLFARDAGEIEALVTDRYLDALLAGEPGLVSLGPADGLARQGGRGVRGSRSRRGSRSGGDGRGERLALDAAVRAASRRLAADLPRFHPSFRFEERLALRLAEAAAAMRLPLAAGSEAEIARIPVAPPTDYDPLAVLPDDEVAESIRPVLIGGAVAASALSLAGAAWLAWRRRSAVSPMARAARAAHASRPPVGRPGRA